MCPPLPPGQPNQPQRLFLAKNSWIPTWNLHWPGLGWGLEQEQQTSLVAVEVSEALGRRVWQLRE